MDELLQRLLVYLRAMWHRRWIGLAVAWIVAMIAVAIAFRIPEKFEASARVYVDTQSLLRPVMSGLAIQPNLDQQVALMSRTLISRPNVEKLVRMADLDLGVKTNAERDDLIDSLMKTLRLEGNVTNNLYVISYRDTKPQQAKNVVQSLLTIFVESSLGDKRQDTRGAVKFLDEQIKRYEQSLQAAENRLKEFKLKYMGIPGQGGQGGPDYFSKMAKLGDDIANARLELRAAEESRDSYKRELAGESPTFLPEGAAPGATVASPEIDGRIAALRSRLDELLRNYTEQHPDVLGTRRMLASLEEQRKEIVQAREKAARASSRPVESVDRNPVFQQMRVSLADAEANVASLRARLSAYESQYAQLKSSARLVPQVEAEFAQLNRDYEVQKKTYGDLLARREAATMGVDVQDTGGTQFRVIDPPRVSPQPVAPTRLSMLWIAFALALGAGLLASFIASELMPTFHDARALREITKRPVLGMVAMLPNESVRRKLRRNIILFAGGLGGLFATFAAILAFALLLGRVA
jgi:polysaccharide chain length determinant protein (PEP-CTERM system associated)